MLLASISPAGATDLDTLRERAQEVADSISVMEHQLADLRDKQDAIDAEIDSLSRELARLDVEIGVVADARSEAIDVYEERALRLYTSGPTQQLEMLMAAQTLPQVLTVQEVAERSADQDELALARLEEAQAKAEELQRSVDERKQKLLAASATAAAIADNVASTLSARRTNLQALNLRIEELEAEARRQAALAQRPGEALLKLLTPAGPAPEIPDDFVGTGVTFEGVASWYGPGFEGNSTASGDVFDSSLYTAASKELPLGSWLFVKHGSKGVVVLVNDRGPYVDGRILDLSQAAAESIGITGLGWIEAEILIER